MSEKKPIFTQAMADAGEFPPVGVQCEYYHGPRRLWVKFIPLLITTITTSPNGIPAIYGEWLHPNDFIWEADIIDDIKKTKFRPARTPIEIEIESLMLSWGHESDEIHANNVVYDVIQQMLEMGYSK